MELKGMILSVGLTLLVGPLAWSQPVNGDILVALSQAAMLRVDAGPDVTLETGGTAVIGEQVYVSGGTPEYTFQWLDEAQNTYDEQSPTVTVAGSYLVVVKDANNCSAEDSLRVLSDPNGVVSGTPGGDQVKAWYDAGRRVIDLQLNNLPGPVSLQLITMEGKVVASEEIGGSDGLWRHRLGVGSVEAGVCILHVRWADRVHSEKIIVK